MCTCCGTQLCDQVSALVESGARDLAERLRCEDRLAAVEALCEAHGKINGLWDEHAMTYVRMVRAALRGVDEK